MYILHSIARIPSFIFFFLSAEEEDDKDKEDEEQTFIKHLVVSPRPRLVLGIDDFTYDLHLLTIASLRDLDVALPDVIVSIDTKIGDGELDQGG